MFGILTFINAVNPDCCKYYQNTFQLVEFPAHTAGSTLNHMYVKKSSLEDYEVEIMVLKTYFSNHDAVRVTISKEYIDFIIY